MKKTRKVAVYPDGSRFELFKQGGFWWWKDNAGSFPLSAAIANVEALGGNVITEPNPNYREPSMFQVWFGRR